MKVNAIEWSLKRENRKDEGYLTAYKLTRISEIRDCLLIMALVPDCFSGGMTIY